MYINLTLSKLYNIPQFSYSCLGSEPGMADYMIWPVCERFDALSILHGDSFKLPGAKLKHLVSIVLDKEE